MKVRIFESMVYDFEDMVYDFEDMVYDFEDMVYDFESTYLTRVISKCVTNTTPARICTPPAPVSGIQQRTLIV